MSSDRMILAPSVLLEVDDHGRMLKSLTTGRQESIDDWPLELMVDMALGGASVERVSPAWRTRADLGQLVQWSDEVTQPLTADPHALAALRRLDDRFSWFLPQVPDDARHAHGLLCEAHAMRRLFRHDLGQCPALPETGLRRALMIRERGARRVALLGDDDMVGVALAAVGVEAVVFDADAYLLRLLENIAGQLELPLSAVEADFRHQAAVEHAGGFDCFLADPMSNPDSLGAFVGFGQQLLRPDGRAWLCAHPAAELICRQQCIRHGFEVAGHWIGFNHYYWSDFRLSDYVSDLYEVLPGDGSPVEASASKQLAPPGRFYDEVVNRAMVIGRLHLVGVGEPHLSPRSMERFTTTLAVMAEDQLLGEQRTVDPSGVTLYTAHLRDGVYLTVRSQLDGGQVELVCAPMVGDLFARLRLAALKYFEVEPKHLHIMRGQGIVNQILENE